MALIFNNSDLQAINKHQTISDFCLVLILVDCVLKKSCYRLSINVKKQTILS